MNFGLVEIIKCHKKTMYYQNKNTEFSQESNKNDWFPSELHYHKSPLPHENNTLIDENQLSQTPQQLTLQSSILSSSENNINNSNNGNNIQKKSFITNSTKVDITNSYSIISRKRY
jgi:hypothetical protein